jgi:acetoin utilization protein AcuC
MLASMRSSAIGLYAGHALGEYGYVEKPWFLPDRLPAFLAELRARGLDRRLAFLEAPPATRDELLLFHTPAHVERTERLCATNEGALDHGPTLARASVERAARHVAGAVLDAARRLIAGDLRRAFVSIAGFHHAHAEQARNYCLYNDCAIALHFLKRLGLSPLAYADVDVHQGDGVFTAFASDPEVVIADLHEDARTLFPHSPEHPGEGPFLGDRSSIGEGLGRGSKLNLPLPAGTGDADFLRAWDEAEAFLEQARPAFVVFESGADGLAGDPMAHLALTPEALRHVTRRVIALADRHAEGRLLVLGGGGYDKANLAAGWCAVIEALLEGQNP